MKCFLFLLCAMLVGTISHATTFSAKTLTKLELTPSKLAPPDTTTGKVIMVTIYPAGKDRRRASFLTGGQLVAGLNEAGLNTRFAKAPSAPYILNFLVVNGYRVVGFERVPEGFVLGIADPTQGYTYLLEKVR